VSPTVPAKKRASETVKKKCSALAFAIAALRFTNSRKTNGRG
jgi:hypothetical protein